MFAAAKEWTTPRTVSLVKEPVNGFGFTIKGECPSQIVDVIPGGPAEVSDVNTRVTRLLHYLPL